MKYFTLAILMILLTACSTVGAKPGATLSAPPTKGPVGRTFSENAEKFEKCAMDSVSVQTDSRQKIEFLFWVTKDGRVAKAEIIQMSEPDPDLHSCLLGVLKKLTFPKPKDLKAKKVNYMISLKSS